MEVHNKKVKKNKYFGYEKIYYIYFTLKNKYKINI